MNFLLFKIMKKKILKKLHINLIKSMKNPNLNLKDILIGRLLNNNIYKKLFLFIIYYNK